MLRASANPGAYYVDGLAHCGACHTPGIHYRRDTLPMSRDELLGLVDVFRRQAGLAWTPEEINDVVEYLNRTRYHFPRN